MKLYHAVNALTLRIWGNEMFLKIVPGIFCLIHQGYLSGGGCSGSFWHGGFLSTAFCPGVYVLIPLRI